MTNYRSKCHLLQIIIKNNRLSDYEEFLKKAIEEHYVVCSVYEYYSKYLHSREGHCILILRHDVDYLTPGTKKMYLLENKYGLTSTYYFRDSTIDVSLMQEMQTNGFEVGYHYETLANLMRSGKVKSREDVKIDILREEFKKELKHFNGILGSEINSCVAHGAPENREIGISNNILFEGIDARDLGVELEGYNPELIDSVQDYISDCGIMYNYGYAYNGLLPSEAMEKKSPVICFLSHPNHWDLTLYQRFRKLVRMLIGKGIYTSDSVFSRLDK